MNAPLSSVAPKRLASSTASLITTATGSWRDCNSYIPRRRIQRSSIPRRSKDHPSWRYASTSASTASTQASNAASSATAAASSATAAAASYDSFDDRYLGAKSSDPSVDNDGASLVTGALYFNSSAGNLRVYNGSAWIAIAADTDVKVLVSSNDSTAGYLNGKLVAGTGISFTENNNGSDETLTITNTGEDPTALAIALG